MEEREIADMSIEELQAEIDTLRAEIDEHKAELEEISKQIPTDLGEGEDVYDTPTPDPEQEKLMERAKELESMILSKEMKISALEKRLRDLQANEGMENYNREE